MQVTAKIKMLNSLVRCKSNMWSFVEFAYTWGCGILMETCFVSCHMREIKEGVSTYPPTVDQYLWGKKIE